MRVFQKHATRTQKIQFTCIIGVMLLANFGFFVNINVRATPMYVLTPLALLLSLAVITAAVLGLKRKESIIHSPFDGKFKKARAMIVTGIMVPFIVSVAVTKGIPACLHLMWNEPSEMRVKITDKRRFYEDETCIGGVIVDAFPFIINNQICGLHRQDWNRAEIGDSLYLAGRHSLLAMSIEQYRLEPRINESDFEQSPLLANASQY